MNFKVTTIIVACSLVTASSAMAKVYRLASPDNKISVSIDDTAGNIAYGIDYEGKVLVKPSVIDLSVEGLPSTAKIKSAKSRNGVSEQIEAPFYRQKQVNSNYNELLLKLNDNRSLEFRAYNSGVAYRFAINSKKDSVIINDEVFQLNFPSDVNTYLPYTTNPGNPTNISFENTYTVAPISKAEDMPAFLPAVADFGGGLKLTLLESDIESFPGLFIVPDTVALAFDGMHAKRPDAFTFSTGNAMAHVKSTENYIAKTSGNRTFPWRIMAITTNDAQMPVNDLVYVLASPNRIGDTSWIKPGKVAWDWWNSWGLKGVDFRAGINTDTYKYYIDFAAKNGIEYVILDEGWYKSSSGDMLTIVPEIDLQELVDYGNQRGVGLVLWAVFSVLDRQLNEACDRYSKMGIKGFKVDFLDRDDQEAVDMAYRIAEKAAKHKMFLDYHGFYKPSGLNRTFPHLLNFEGVYGLEQCKWQDAKVDHPLYDVTMPFIRMMAGPVDYTPGAMRNATRIDWKPVYYNPVSMGTRCHQMGEYVVFDAPFLMLCDSPSSYEDEAECTEYLAAIPTVYDETIIPTAEMGNYIVTARRSGKDWFVGGLTNWSSRDVDLDFSFLPEGVTYEATMFVDGMNAHRLATDYKKKSQTIDRSSRIKIHMAPGGGFAMRLTPGK